MVLVSKLAWRNLCRRPWQSVLLLLALCLSTSTLSVALALEEMGYQPWDRLSNATNGFHVTVGARPGPGVNATEADLATAVKSLEELRNRPGVTALGGPWRESVTTGNRVGTRDIDLTVQVRDAAPSAVDQPKLTAGRWLDAGEGVVLEDGLATTLGARPGDMITLAGKRVAVLGTAMSVAVMPYPLETRDRGFVWAGAATAIDPAAVQRKQVTAQLRLSNPDDAPAFAHNGPKLVLPDGFESGMYEFQLMRRGSDGKLSFIALALGLTATLLAGLTISTVGVIVAERMAAQIRRVGALKAVGVTPMQVTLILLAEYVAMAVMATAVGLGLSTLAAPLFAGNLRILYGAPEPPTITLSRAALVLAASVALVVVATVRPALRGARQSTLRQLGAQSRPPRPSSGLARLATGLRLPLPAVLGLRSVTRRPGRTVGTVVVLTLAMAMVTIGLILRQRTAGFLAEVRVRNHGDEFEIAEDMAVFHQLITIVMFSAGLLIALAAINSAVAAVFAARDSARNHAILRTLGATPRQTAVAFVIAQLGACVAACGLGIPLGILLFNTLGGQALAPATLATSAYLVLGLIAVVVYAGIVTVPARVLAAQRITPQLSYE